MITSNYRIFYIIVVNDVKRLAYRQKLESVNLNIGEINIRRETTEYYINTDIPINIHCETTEYYINADIPVDLDQIAHIEMAYYFTAILMTNGDVYARYFGIYYKLTFPDDDVIVKISEYNKHMFIALGQSNRLYKISHNDVILIDVEDQIIDFNCHGNIYLTANNYLYRGICNKNSRVLFNSNTKLLFFDILISIDTAENIVGINTGQKYFANDGCFEIINSICISNFIKNVFLILDSEYNLRILIDSQIHLVEQFWTRGEIVSGIYKNEDFIVVTTTDNILYYCKIVNSEVIIKNRIDDKYPAVRPCLNIKSARSVK